MWYCIFMIILGQISGFWGTVSSMHVINVNSPHNLYFYGHDYSFYSPRTVCYPHHSSMIIPSFEHNSNTKSIHLLPNRSYTMSPRHHEPYVSQSDRVESPYSSTLYKLICDRYNALCVLLRAFLTDIITFTWQPLVRWRRIHYRHLT